MKKYIEIEVNDDDDLGLIIERTTPEIRRNVLVNFIIESSICEICGTVGTNYVNDFTVGSPDNLSLVYDIHSEHAFCDRHKRNSRIYYGQNTGDTIRVRNE